MARRRAHRRRYALAALLSLVLAAVVAAIVLDAPPTSAPVGESEGEDHPDDAARFRQLQLQNEDGVIPPDAYLKAARQADRIRTATGQADDVAGIDSGGWTWLGPGNVGGRTRAIVVHPTTPATMWAATVGGGVWKTTNSGGRWDPLDDFMANLHVSSLVIDPDDDDVLYAGTGEGFAGHNQSFDAFRGAGVFRSGDGGATWQHIPTTGGANWHFVNRLTIDPNDSRIILAATSTGIWRTANTGATAWARVNNPTAADVDFHPTDSDFAVAGGYGQAWYSLTGGGSWSPATGLPATGRVELAYARSNPSTVYASVDANSGEIWKSVNGGQSYVRQSTGFGYLSTQGSYDNIIWVDPTNANVLVVGGIDLWKSTNGGVGLTKISNWSSEQQSGNSVHADQHAIVEHPAFNGTTSTNGRTVFFTNDGGIYKTADIYGVQQTTGWQELNNNLGGTQFYSGAGNPTSGRLVGGTQDNGTPSSGVGTDGWGYIFGGDGGAVAADLTNTNYFYGEYVYLRLFRNTNGGASRAGTDYIAGGNAALNGNGDCLKAVPYSIPDACNKTANFIAPFLLDPNEPNRILAGGLSLWRTNDARAPNSAATGPQWAAIKAPTSATSPSRISAIAVAGGDSRHIWVGHNNGLIYRTTTGTNVVPAWDRVDLAEMPSRMVLDLEIDPADSDVAYATFGGFATENVWRTEDGGENWVVRTGSGATKLPDAPVRSLLVQPGNSNRLYAGTEVGAFASEDAGVTWLLPNGAPANVSVDQLFWMSPTRLVAATHGRGMFSTDVATVRPANNAFADAGILAGATANRTGDTNVAATKEPHEPNHHENVGGASVWYRWVAPTSGPVTIDTATSPFDTTLAVYTGGAVDALTKIISNDDENHPAVISSKVQFDAAAGTTYQIAVDGFRPPAGAVPTGQINLHLAQGPAVFHELTVTKAGTGTGTVTSSPAGIDCGATCAGSFSQGTTVTLAAAATGLSSFAGWSGACTGTTPTCPVTMDAAKAVTATFEPDSTAPVNPALSSSTHTPSTWSSNRQIAVTWTGASDSGTGVDGFSFVFDQTPTTTPDEVLDGQETATTATSGLSPDGSSHYFHLRTRDNAGNWSVASHLGPFFVDGSAPVDPGLTSPSHPTPAPSLDPTVDITWAGATDGHSQVDGFSYHFDSSAASLPDQVMDAGAAATGTTSSTLAPGTYYFHLRTRDKAGNWTATAHLGPFVIVAPPDLVPPTVATLTSPTHAVGAWSASNAIRVTWSAADAASGLDGFSYHWDGSAASEPDLLKDVEEGAAETTSPALGTGAQYFHLRARDNGGNWSTTVHAGPFYVDVTAPTNPTPRSTSHVVGRRSTDRTIDFVWSGAADPGSGVDGFSLSLSTSPSAAPDLTKDAEESATGATSVALPAGSYYFQIRTRDNVGHWSTPAMVGPFVLAAARETTRARCTVPNVRGMTLREARTKLSRARCRLGVVSRRFSKTVRAGRIVSQRPAPRTKLRQGGRVAVTLSRGKRR